MEEAIGEFIANERRLIEHAATELMSYEREMAFASAVDVCSSDSTLPPTEAKKPWADLLTSAPTDQQILTSEAAAAQIKKREERREQDKIRYHEMLRELQRKLRPSNKSGPDYDEDVPSGRSFSHSSLISMDEIDKDS